MIKTDKVPTWVEKLFLPTVNEIKGELKALNTRVDATNIKIDEGLKSVNIKIEEGLKSVNTRIDATNDKMEAGFKELNTKIEEGLKRVDARIDATNEHIHHLEERIGNRFANI